MRRRAALACSAVVPPDLTAVYPGSSLFSKHFDSKLERLACCRRASKASAPSGSSTPTSNGSPWSSCSASIMSVLDTTIVNVALESLSKDLHAPLDQRSMGSDRAISWRWPRSSRCADGPSAVSAASAVYLLALILFTASSALCGLASSLAELVAFRVLQGIGGGLLGPDRLDDPG